MVHDFRYKFHALSFPNVIYDNAVVVATRYRALAVLTKVQTVDRLWVRISSSDSETSEEAIGDSHCGTVFKKKQKCDLGVIARPFYDYNSMKLLRHLKSMLRNSHL